MSALTDKNRQKAEKKVLSYIKIKCKKCQGNMERFDYKYLENDAVVGYRCEDCPHYYLFN